LRGGLGPPFLVSWGTKRLVFHFLTSLFLVEDFVKESVISLVEVLVELVCKFQAETFILEQVFPVSLEVLKHQMNEAFLHQVGVFNESKLLVNPLWPVLGNLSFEVSLQFLLRHYR